ncbi:Disease resistance protein RPP5 [Linum perenne]
MAALSEKKIRTFIDDKLKKTEGIDELISILQRCALSVVVFSETFADSAWCLEEVATIARRMEKFGQRVLPVFYKVDPPDVIDDFGSYAATIDHECKGNNRPKDKKIWIDGLKAMANCAGRASLMDCPIVVLRTIHSNKLTKLTSSDRSYSKDFL